MIITGSLCGISKASLLRAHTSELKTVVSMLREISEMIRYRRSTTDEIRSMLSSHIGYDSLAAGNVQTLNTEEQKLLSDILAKLGTTDAKGQLAIIEHGISRFCEYADEASSEQRNKSRLFEVLGFMAGAFAAVLFI